MKPENLSEAAVILALHQKHKLNEGDAAPYGEYNQDQLENDISNDNADEPTLWMDDDYLYRCPECGEYMTCDEYLGDEKVECPNCGKTVELEFIDEIDDVEVFDECGDDCDDAIECASVKECSEPSDLHEVEIQIKNGKKIKFKKAKKKGFSRVGGKYKKMSSKEKMARKKAGKKLAKAAKKKKGQIARKRKKSMKKRDAMGLNSGMRLYNTSEPSINESRVLNLLNRALTESFSRNSQFIPFTLTSISEAVYNKSTDKLNLKCCGQYEDGEKVETEFEIDNATDESKKSNIKEHTGAFELDATISETNLLLKSNESVNIDKLKVIPVINNALSEAFARFPDYLPFVITDISEAVYNESTDKLNLKCCGQYEDGEKVETEFEVDNVADESKDSKLTENTGVFDLPGVRINVDTKMTNESITIE